MLALDVGFRLGVALAGGVAVAGVAQAVTSNAITRNTKTNLLLIFMVSSSEIGVSAYRINKLSK